jgi:hypothetical protein
LEKRERYAKNLGLQIESKRTVSPEAISQSTLNFGPPDDEEARRRDERIRLQRRWLEDQMLEKHARDNSSVLAVEAPIEEQKSRRREHHRRVAQFNEQMASRKTSPEIEVHPSLTSLPSGIPHTKQTDYRGVKKPEEAELLRRENERVRAIKTMKESSMKVNDERFHQEVKVRLEEDARREEEKIRARKEAQKRAVEMSISNAEQARIARKHADQQNDNLRYVIVIYIQIYLVFNTTRNS